MSSELEQFLTPYSPMMQELALKLRTLICEVMPDTIEQLDTPAHLIGYGLDRTYKGLICGIMMVKVRGEFIWHAHPDTDDFFLVLKGRLSIRLGDREVVLGPASCSSSRAASSTSRSPRRRRTCC